MRQLPDNCVDAIIADPPYGTTNIGWDKSIDWSAFWREAHRIAACDTAPIVLFSAQPFTTDLIISNRECFRYEIIWEKTIAAGYLDASRRPLKAHENILVFSKKFKQSTYNPQKVKGKPYITKRGRAAPHYASVETVWTENKGDRYPRSVLHYPTAQKQGHPTSKPLELIKWLVNTYTNENAIVLDPFMGSGTTAVACIETQRRYIGVEKLPKYVDLAKCRITSISSKTGKQ